VEVLFIAQRLGYRTLEVPVRWNDVAGTKVKMLGALAAFLDPVKVRWNSSPANINSQRLAFSARLFGHVEGSGLFVAHAAAQSPLQFHRGAVSGPRNRRQYRHLFPPRPGDPAIAPGERPAAPRGAPYRVQRFRQQLQRQQRASRFLPHVPRSARPRPGLQRRDRAYGLRSHAGAPGAGRAGLGRMVSGNFFQTLGVGAAWAAY
jgi:hypothetical protein